MEAHAFRRWRQEDHEFKVILQYVSRHRVLEKKKRQSHTLDLHSCLEWPAGGHGLRHSDWDLFFQTRHGR